MMVVDKGNLIGEEPMEAATVEQEPAVDVQEVVSQPTATATYCSRRSELRLVRVPIRPIWGEGGVKRGETEGQRLVFRDGLLTVPLEGTVRLDGNHEADAKEIVDWLDNHVLNGDANDGFWRVSRVAPAPSSQELSALMAAAVKLDTDFIEAFIETERGGWNREELIETAQGALEKVQQAVVEMKAAAAAQENGGA